MQIHKVRNVCQALPLTVDYLMKHGTPESSRAGNVLVAPCPMMTVTEEPCERVLFSSVRDANPFFHMAESIWMLAGREDAEFLDNFITGFGLRYGEETGKIHDAYGHRWRKAFGFDQLQCVIEKLKANPFDRQAVISMWDPRGWPMGYDDLRGNWRSRPCNTTIY